MAIAISDPIGPRLANATVSYRDATETWEAHRDKWQQLITDAVDQGMGLAQVAKLAGISAPRVLAIVARVYGQRAS